MSTTGVLRHCRLSGACSVSHIELLQICTTILVFGRRIAVPYVRVGERPPPSAILSGGIRVHTAASIPLVHGGVFDLTRPDADPDRWIVTVRHEYICMRVCVRVGDVETMLLDVYICVYV